MTGTVDVDQVDRELLQWLQDDFPVTGRPWLEGGDVLGISEDEVIARVRRLSREGVIRSVHTILDRQKTGSGSSTLIAMRVPAEMMEGTVSVVNEYPGVTHNYLREHEFNLWFTINAGNEPELDAIIRGIQQKTGAMDEDILDLRTVRVFKTDVRFRFSNRTHTSRARDELPYLVTVMDETDRALLRITQNAIPLVLEPFGTVAEQLHIGHDEVLIRLQRLLRDRIIKRIGGSLNQRKLGIVANAVVAWDVPPDKIEETGVMFSSCDEVTHCYERRTVPGSWEYSMFTVLHGYNREWVKAYAASLSELTKIPDYIVIFSTKQFKRTSIIHDLKETPQRNEARDGNSDKKCALG